MMSGKKHYNGKLLTWICDCPAPMSDLMYATDEMCPACGMEKPTDDTVNIKRQLLRRQASKGGQTRALKLSPERRKEISVEANKAKNGKTK